MISETSKLSLPFGVACAVLFGWLLFLTSMVFQVKEDVAVIKAVLVSGHATAIAAK